MAATQLGTTFEQIRSRFDAELDDFYAGYPSNTENLEAEMNRLAAAHPEWNAFQTKAALYDAISRLADVHIFRYMPFYFEVKTGRSRFSWGIGGVGAWLFESSFGLDYRARAKEIQDEYADFFAFNSPFAAAFDHDHHCVGYDNVLAKGLKGTLNEIETRLRQGVAANEGDFLLSAASGLRALMRISEHFAARAENMLAIETDPLVRGNLIRIRDAARRCPTNPPESFYEALNALIFMREICGSFEGMGISTFGQVDRMLYPYYQRDMQSGRIDQAEARYLLDAFLAYTEVKFECRTSRHETSTTVVIGGCGSDGVPVFNDITQMIIASYRELRLGEPKLHCRISPDHPDQYFKQVAELVADGLNVSAIYNDPTVISANVRCGRDIGDARLYAGGGCQENLLANTELSSRATLYCNLPNVLLLTLFPDRFSPPPEVVLPADSRKGATVDFECLYSAFIANLGAISRALVGRRNLLEAEGVLFNPCPLLSSTIDDCILRGRDMTDGGTRYSSGSIGLTGPATLIDSLYVLKRLVFDEGSIAFESLKAALLSDWQGVEPLRRRIITDARRYGRGDSEIRDFSARVFEDIARATSGMPNARGGRYEASLFSHTTYRGLAKRTGATPDGRRSGDDLAKGIGPSFLTLGESCPATDILRSIEPIDFTAFTVIGVLDLKFPQMRGKKNNNGGRIIESVIRHFLDCGGPVLQINCLDQAELIGARLHPEQHSDLIVRVSGFSARFVTLDPKLQEEIINRTAAIV